MIRPLRLLVLVALCTGCAGPADHELNTVGAGRASTIPAVAQQWHGSAGIAWSSDGEPAYLPGKYEQPDLAVSGDGHALAWLHGYRGTANRQSAWFERAKGPDRTWHAGRWVSVARSHAQDADLFDFVGDSTVIGYGGTTGLWISRNGGSRWHETLSGWTVDEASEVGHRLLVAANRCHDSGTCPTVLLSSTRSLTRFRRLRHRLPSDESVEAILSLTGRVAAIAERTQRRITLAVTNDGGHTWTTRGIPCGSLHNDPDVNSAASTLWLTCLTRSDGMGPGDGTYATYRSLDAGRTWTDMTAHGKPAFDLIALPVSSRQAWGEQPSNEDEVALLRTVDGGAHWMRVTPPPRTTGDAAYVALAPQSRNTTLCLVQVIHSRGTSFTVYRTTTGGRRWRATRLPEPPNR